MILLRRIGLDVAGVQETVENIQRFLGVDAGLYDNFGAQCSGGEINGSEDRGLAAAEFQEFHRLGQHCSFHAEISRKVP